MPRHVNSWFLLIWLTGVACHVPVVETFAGETFPHAVVAADHPQASAAGLEMLQRGGNVVDAAVATAFALSVVRPEGTGIGGGGFMLIYDADRQSAVAIDYREQAPSSASREMFLESPRDAVPLPSRHGGLAIAVPCEIKGLCLALERHGTLDLATVLEPAIRLAREGVVVDDHHENSRRSVLRDIERIPDGYNRFAPLVELYLQSPEGTDSPQRFSSPLLEVLEILADQGADGFYQGPVAEALVAAVQQAGGIITLDDLSAVQPVIREPLRASGAGGTWFTMPPPSSGGVALLEMLAVIAEAEQQGEFSLQEWEHNSPQYVHFVAEVMQHAFADRAEFLGDADFVDVPVARLLSPEHARALAMRIDEFTHPREHYGRFAAADDAGTSHFSVIDAAGNAVACTGTINTLYGSYVVVPHYGIVLNNQMDDFAALPGEPNAFGLLQGEANSIAPGKRPLSSMSPTIMVRDGRAVFAAGGSGGPRIISATLQVLLNLTRFELPIEQAVSAPRFHHQWLPDVLELEPPLAGQLRDQLTERGHHIVERNALGVCQAVLRLSDGNVQGMSDPRKGGEPAGY